MKKYFLFLFILYSCIVFAQQEILQDDGRTIILNKDGTWKYKQVSANGFGTLTDVRDGKIYKTIKIGTQTWMAENLAYKTPYGNTWVLENDISNLAIYGYLYDDVASKNCCPSGWHLPSNAEWTTLVNFLGGELLAADKLREAGTVHWVFPNASSNNSSKFTALPGGYRSTSGTYINEYHESIWWSSGEIHAYLRIDKTGLSIWSHTNLSFEYSYVGFGCYVRCLKNK